MKKKILAVVLASAMVVSMSGCGTSGAENGTETQSGDVSATTNGQSSVSMGVKAEEYVTNLCDYNGIDINLSSTYEVTDADVTETMTALMGSMGVEPVEIVDRTIIQEGDYVKVDYTGLKDGEAFEGGSNTDVLIDVSNNLDVNGGFPYIDGFSDGLIGAEVGTTIECDVTFPEDYGKDELNGQAVVFRFDIKGIYAPLTIEDLTDDIVKETFSEGYNLSTVEELTEYVKNYLGYTAESSKYNEIVDGVKQYVLENSEVTVPEDYLEARLQEYEVSYEKSNCSEGQSLEEFLSSTYGIDLAAAEETWRPALEEQIKIEFLFTIIAQKEGITLDDDEFATYVASFQTNSALSLADENSVYEYFGAGNAEDGQVYLKQLYLINKAIDLVSEKANIVMPENEADDSTEETTEATESAESVEEDTEE